MDRALFCILYFRKEHISMLSKKTVDDLTNVSGKKVLVRCDFNVPLKDGVIQNYNRIDGALPTIKKLLEGGAKFPSWKTKGRAIARNVPCASGRSIVRKIRAYRKVCK